MSAEPIDRPPVLITWLDSKVAFTGWQFPEDIEAPSLKPTRTAGWILLETAQCVLVVSTAGAGQVAGGIIIPRPAIVRIDQLDTIGARPDAR